MEQLLKTGLQNSFVVMPASVIISFTGIFVAALLFSKGTRLAGALRFLLVISAAVVSGCALWVTNLMWLIKTSSSFTHHYDASSIFSGLFLGISVSYAGFVIASLQRTVIYRAVGGAVVGIGAFVMHYVGLFSVDIIDLSSVHLSTATLLLIVSVAFPAMALSWSIAVNSFFPKVITTLISTVGLLVLHQAGFSDLVFIPISQANAVEGLDDAELITFILVFSSMALTLGISTFLLFNLSQLDRKKQSEHLSNFDALTGTPNRTSLEALLSQILLDKSYKHAVVSFDFSRFKTINEVHGRNAGDHVLKLLTKRVAEAFKKDEMLFRVGGDEFIAIKKNVANAYEALEFSNRIRDAAVGDISWESKILSVGISLGVSLFPDDGTSGEDLIAKASLAMSRAKKDSLGRPAFYDPEKDDQNLERSALSIDLRNAITNNEFKLFYQRQNNIIDGKLVGYEVLLRWKHPSFGFVSPEIFIPLAEESDLILDIGEWVLRTACFEAASWQNEVKIAVNVAAKQLADDNLPDTVKRILEESGLPASRLEIEITESGVIADMEHASVIVTKIKKLGVSIAMDDFGVGYSSLSTFQFLPFDKIKIDKGFIKDITTNIPKQAIVKSTILLGKNLNIAILAEGVENREELAFLREQGCDYVQGYLFGRPISSDVMLTANAA